MGVDPETPDDAEDVPELQVSLGGVADPAPEEEDGEEAGQAPLSKGASLLKCYVCGTPATLFKPLLYHGLILHCDKRECSRECEECKDWERSIEEGGGTCSDAGQSLSVASRVSATAAEDPPQMPGNQSGGSPGPPPPAAHNVGTSEQVPTEGYAAMMARLKGGKH